MFKKKNYNNRYEDRKTFYNQENVPVKKHDDSLFSYVHQSCCVPRGGSMLFQEFLCHLPMSILALSISLFLIILFDGVFSGFVTIDIKRAIYLNLFHVSHYIHILFASFASFYAFANFFILKKMWLGCLLAIINSFIFCTIADILLPTLGALFLDNTINIHFCFLHYYDLCNAFYFALFGIFAAYCLLKGDKKYAVLVAKKVHLGHVWFGSIAALLYLFSQVKIDLIIHISFLFVLLFFSVVIPCVFSDICIPYIFNHYIDKKHDYQGVKIDY